MNKHRRDASTIRLVYSVSEGVMKSETGNNRTVLTEPQLGIMAARRKGRSRTSFTILTQPMGRKTKTGCCSTTNDNVSTFKLT